MYATAAEKWQIFTIFKSQQIWCFLQFNYGIEFKITWSNCCLISKIIKSIFHVFSIGTRYWLKSISLQERQSSHQGRVITYVRRATRNYPVIFGNVANGDILIYCVLTFHDYYRSPRFIVPASSLLISYRAMLRELKQFIGYQLFPQK